MGEDKPNSVGIHRIESEPEDSKVASLPLLNRLLLEVMRTGDKPTPPPGRTKIDMPLDIVIFLLRPDELAKLQKYIASYLGKH